MEKYGVENIQKILFVMFDSVMAVDKMAAHEGILSLLQFTSDFSAMGTFNLDQFKLEVSEFSPEERADMKAKLKAKLVMHNPALEAKLESGVDLVDEGVGLVEANVAYVNKVKALLQV